MHFLFFETNAFGAKEYIAVVVAFISLGTLIKGLVEYSKAQTWKKAEFISKEVKEFYSTPSVIRALKFIDWDEGEVGLNPGELGNKPTLYFTNELLIQALRNHNEGNDRFTIEEAKIREIIDGLLDKLSLFQHYIDGGLFSAKELKGYLKYWTDIMFDEQSDRVMKAGFRQALKKYIHSYKFYDLIKLGNSLGYTLN